MERHDVAGHQGELALPNPAKLVPPSAAITAFNCDLTNNSALVTPARVAK
jgi:hypothetical protein